MDQMNRRRTLLAAIITTIVLGAATPAAAHAWIPQWWQYDKVVWRYGWRHSDRLLAEHLGWHDDHPTYSEYQRSRDLHYDEHGTLRHKWRHLHFHRALSWAKGYATWYDHSGAVGACGVPLRGSYAASRTLPCGSFVSVRHAGKYVFVRVLDRGPYGSSSRILDLSEAAFRELAPLWSGVIYVKAVRLEKKK